MKVLDSIGKDLLIIKKGILRQFAFFILAFFFNTFWIVAYFEMRAGRFRNTGNSFQTIIIAFMIMCCLVYLAWYLLEYSEGFFSYATLILPLMVVTIIYKINICVPCISINIVIAGMIIYIIYTYLLPIIKRKCQS